MSVEYETCKVCNHSTYRYRCDGCDIHIDRDKTWIELHLPKLLGEPATSKRVCSVPCLQDVITDLTTKLNKNNTIFAELLYRDNHKE